MFEIGQEVTVINEKGVAYSGVIMARATGEAGQKAYKISIDGGGLNQLGQWHKASDVFVIDSPAQSAYEDFPESFLRQ
jgi:hypothetical protein